ncbi:FAD-dependent oxidoreductase [Granulosicoccaceae sp. 1_MG-2023]|nr:FAD-dependent oxidoreductase [Granulosicoccaceae sp. 1_MG-2023]
MHYVIIGAGPTGVLAAEHLRKLDKHSDITIVGDEPEPPYSRMAIPYHLIGNIGEEGTYLRKDEGHFEKLNINVRQALLSRLERDTKTLTLSNGETLSYDKLLLATGSHPIQPPIPGIDLPQVSTCWTLEDARKIRDLAGEHAKVVLMGAGFIGSIVLEALALRRVDLTVVEMGDRMVPRMMNQTAGNLLSAWARSKGVTVHTSTKIESIRANKSRWWRRAKHPLKVHLDQGEELDADLLISAAGVRSNFDFLEGTGIETEQGILVNDHLQTNDPCIYAAGDVAQGRDFSTGEYTVQAIQPTAAEHAKIAANNMVRDNSVTHRGSVNMNVLDTLGLISTSFGLWMGVDGGDSCELLDEADYRYIQLQFDGDVLVGASSLGMTQHMGVIRGLIQSAVPLGKWKARLMDDPTRVMEAYLATVQAQAVAAKV